MLTFDPTVNPVTLTVDKDLTCADPTTTGNYCELKGITSPEPNKNIDFPPTGDKFIWEATANTFTLKFELKRPQMAQDLNVDTNYFPTSTVIARKLDGACPTSDFALASSDHHNYMSAQTYRSK